MTAVRRNRGYQNAFDLKFSRGSILIVPHHIIPSRQIMG
jgi:hypothetical protein